MPLADVGPSLKLISVSNIESGTAPMTRPVRFPSIRVSAAIMAALLLAAPLPVLAQDNALPAATVRVDPVIEQPMDATVPAVARIVTSTGGVIAAQINGPVDEVKAQVGDIVHKGDILATLDQDRLRFTVELAEAEVATAAADLATVRAEKQQADLAFARLTGLRNSAAFSQARYEDAQTEVLRTQSEITAAAARLQRAEANLELARLDLDRSSVRAPYDGVITQRQAEPGSYVTSGMPIVSMLNLDRLELEADVPYDRLGGLKTGAEVTARFDNGETGTLSVRAVIPQENPLTRTRAVRFAIVAGPPVEQLAVNASAAIDIPLNADGVAITVHKDGIIKQPNGATAFIVIPTDDGGYQAALREVVIGDSIGNRFVVRSGLAVGDRVVVRGNERLQPGQRLSLPDQG